MSEADRPGIITPAWPVAPHVRAFCTTRQGGVSRGPWHSFNLSDRVGDDAACVRQNRDILTAALGLPAAPLWLRQAHGRSVLEAGPRARPGSESDASVTRAPGVVCAVLAADCLPILITDRAGTVVAAAHAGWRGLSAGVVEATVGAMRGGAKSGQDELIAWLGPAIGPRRFIVGADVYAAFTTRDRQAREAFTPCGKQRWQCDLYMLARQRLAAVGVAAISGGEYCAYTEADKFFSYRRDRLTGRMASLIYLEK